MRWGTLAGQFAIVASSKHDLRSVSKSATSLLVGTAIDRKLIAGTDEKVLKFFPEFAGLVSAEWQDVSIGNLLLE